MCEVIEVVPIPIDTETDNSVSIEEKLPTKKKSWKRFFKFLSSGKSKSKEVTTKDLSIKSETQQVKSEDEPLNSESPQTVEVVEELPVVPEKRKRLSLKWMFRNKNKSKNQIKSSNNVLSSKTFVEVLDSQSELSEVVEVDLKSTSKVEEAKTEFGATGDGLIDSKIENLSEAIFGFDRHLAIPEIFEDCRTEAPHIKESSKKHSLRRLIKNPFCRRNPSKMNLASKTFIDDTELIDDFPMLNEASPSDENQVNLHEDQSPLHSDDQIKTEEHLESENVENAETEDADNSNKASGDSKDAETESDDNTAKSEDFEVKANCPEDKAEIKNPEYDQYASASPTQTLNDKHIDADSKDKKLFEKYRVPKNRERKIRFTLPTIEELPELPDSDNEEAPKCDDIPDTNEDENANEPILIGDCVNGDNCDDTLPTYDEISPDSINDKNLEEILEVKEVEVDQN